MATFRACMICFALIATIPHIAHAQSSRPSLDREICDSDSVVGLMSRRLDGVYLRNSITLSASTVEVLHPISTYYDRVSGSTFCSARLMYERPDGSNHVLQTMFDLIASDNGKIFVYNFTFDFSPAR